MNTIQFLFFDTSAPSRSLYTSFNQKYCYLIFTSWT